MTKAIVHIINHAYLICNFHAYCDTELIFKSSACSYFLHAIEPEVCSTDRALALLNTP